MTPGSGVYLIRREDIARLHEPGNEELCERVEECLTIFVDLFGRYCGRPMGLGRLDEDAACAELYEHLEALRDEDPFWRRFTEQADHYLKLRDEFRQDGWTWGIRGTAEVYMEAALDRLCFLDAYPALVETMDRLAKEFGSTAAPAA